MRLQFIQSTKKARFNPWAADTTPSYGAYRPSTPPLTGQAEEKTTACDDDDEDVENSPYIPSSPTYSDYGNDDMDEDGPPSPAYMPSSPTYSSSGGSCLYDSD
jgi:hypothetical protein